MTNEPPIDIFARVTELEDRAAKQDEAIAQLSQAVAHLAQRVTEVEASVKPMTEKVVQLERCAHDHNEDGGIVEQ